MEHGRATPGLHGNATTICWTSANVDGTTTELDATLRSTARVWARYAMAVGPRWFAATATKGNSVSRDSLYSVFH